MVLLLFVNIIVDMPSILSICVYKIIQIQSQPPYQYNSLIKILANTLKRYLRLKNNPIKVISYILLYFSFCLANSFNILLTL